MSKCHIVGNHMLRLIAGMYKLLQHLAMNNGPSHHNQEGWRVSDIDKVSFGESAKCWLSSFQPVFSMSKVTYFAT